MFTIREEKIYQVKLNDGREIDFVVTDEDDETYRLESRDCLGEYVPATQLDGWLDDLWNHQFPAELKELIVPTQRKHKTPRGKVLDETRYLFLPSAAEIFPEEDCYGDEGLYEQMEYYKIPQNRIRCKQKGDPYPDWYWTSSADSGNSTYWCYTYSSGNAGSTAATNTSIAAPVCFRIRKS